MKRYDVDWTPEIGEALAKIAEEVTNETGKIEAIQTLFLYHHRR